MIKLGYSEAHSEMTGNPEKALIVQSDRTLLLDVRCKTACTTRRAVILFAGLEKSPEHIHTCRITPLSLWNAASAGFMVHDLLNVLNEHSRYEIQSDIAAGFSLLIFRYGKIRMVPD